MGRLGYFHSMAVYVGHRADNRDRNRPCIKIWVRDERASRPGRFGLF